MVYTVTVRFSTSTSFAVRIVMLSPAWEFGRHCAKVNNPQVIARRETD
jgi:hypothetical protein